MKRKIVSINEDKCNGCGLCVTACHEGALQLVDGKAKLVSEAYCDGLGDCLPKCPAGAITIEERVAAPYNEEAVKAAQARQTTQAKQATQAEQATAAFPQESTATATTLPCGCPGTQTKMLRTNTAPAAKAKINTADTTDPELNVSQLRQWPCQIKLVPANAPYLDQAHLLIAADCTAYAYAGIHQDFMRNKITLIGCPKLDAVDYAEKLTAILKTHEIKSITLLRMEVPCCGGLVNAVKKALLDSGQMIPWQVITLSTDGHILEE